MVLVNSYGLPIFANTNYCFLQDSSYTGARSVASSMQCYSWEATSMILKVSGILSDCISYSCIYSELALNSILDCNVSFLTCSYWSCSLSSFYSNLDSKNLLSDINVCFSALRLRILNCDHLFCRLLDFSWSRIILAPCWTWFSWSRIISTCSWILQCWLPSSFFVRGLSLRAACRPLSLEIQPGGLASRAFIYVLWDSYSALRYRFATPGS